MSGYVGVASLASTGTVAATTMVSGGGDALQTAIDGASSGDTIEVVDSATYNPTVVDVGVTIETTADPTIAGTGGISTAVSIEADDVTLDGFTVTNPDELLGVKVEVGYDDPTVVNNTVDARVRDRATCG